MIAAIVGDLGPTLVLVLCASALVLLLACVNVTNLLLTSSAVRAREMAIRVALGATAGRIVRQLLTESLVLVTIGTVLGLGLAFAGVRLLLWFGAATLPRLTSIPFDTNVVLFALAALVTTSVLVGVTPALRLASTDVTKVMNAGGRSATAGRAQQRTLMVFVVVEIALAIVLVAGAGWLVRSFANLETSNPGFVADGRLAVDVLLPFAKYNSPDRVLVWSHEVTERLRAIRGVRTVGSAPIFLYIRDATRLVSPMSRSRDNPTIPIIHGRPATSASARSFLMRWASSCSRAAASPPTIDQARRPSRS